MNETAAVTNTTSAFRALDTTATLRPAKLECPRCRQGCPHPPLLNVLYADKIEFHNCPACGGAWFYEKDADIALRATGAFEWPRPSALPAAQSAELRCPCCSGSLVTVHDRRGSGATVRRCLVCYGGWMNYIDLKVASEASRTILNRLRKMFTK